MKTYLTTVCFTILLLFSFNNLTQAQDFKGVATYQTKTTLKLDNFGNRQLSEQQKKEMMERMKSFLEKTYTLTFTQSESIYKEEEKLEVSAGGRGRGFMFGGGGGSGPIYKNIKEKQFLQEQEFLGKQFLIKDSLKTITWKMGSESKQIGQYLCFKATATKPVEGFDWQRNRPGRDNENKEVEKPTDSTTITEEAKNKEETPREIEIVAWYTPQVAVSQGPAEYWGLPGLILELSADNTTMLCTKIVINPAESDEIKSLTKGKEVTKEEYNEIMTVKMQEMREVFRRRRNN
ncbi:GLPGLI family protein [Flaviramulus sp. BrNp1-15]|uniref:GLPGLI family protein n=1 Tax=Flaviramulus sp. BrNp1-15 TaxID=2916754 RepID=UPI001EE8BFA8|nr:GLPGLI family protein [Flaviramulus sp. BrNp1-15]ULC59302.1 GLPGLI family protein [Flaviramulus sp. BrNp1-15]